MSLQVKGMSLPVHPFHSPGTSFNVGETVRIHRADLQIPRYPSAAFEISLRQNVIVGDDIFIIFSAKDFQVANVYQHSAYAINGDFGVSFLLVSQFHN
jgi:hypothetical protein